MGPRPTVFHSAKDARQNALPKPSAFDKENRPKLIGAAVLLLVVLVFFATASAHWAAGTRKRHSPPASGVRRSARRPVREAARTRAPHPPKSADARARQSRSCRRAGS